MSRTVQITFDAADPEGLASFWAEALGYKPQPPPPGFATWEQFALDNDFPEAELASFSALVDPDHTGPRLFFQKVPEGKAGKNRVHLDVNVTEHGHGDAERRRAIAAEVARLEALGARRIAEFDEHKGIWTVMQDPEGNEFCIQ